MDRKILKFSYWLSMILTIIGAWLKIIHAEGAEEFVICALLATGFFLYVFISDTRKSLYMNSTEKLMWVIGFIFMGWLAGFLYLTNHRRHHRLS
jgi:hypothetical protein